MPKGEHLKGKGRPREKGETGIALPARIEEVARLVVWGFGVTEISQRFGVTKVTAQNYVKEAEEKKLINKYTEIRDSQVKVIVSKNLDILSETTEMLLERVEEWRRISAEGTEDEKKTLPNVGTIIAVAAHAAKITGTVQDDKPTEVNIEKVQQNIMILQNTEDEIVTRISKSLLGLNKCIDTDKVDNVTSTVK